MYFHLLQAWCKAFKSHLASIETSSENNYVKQEAAQHGGKYILILYFYSDKDGSLVSFNSRGVSPDNISEWLSRRP